MELWHVMVFVVYPLPFLILGGIQLFSPKGSSEYSFCQFYKWVPCLNWLMVWAYLYSLFTDGRAP